MRHEIEKLRIEKMRSFFILANSMVEAQHAAPKTRIFIAPSNYESTPVFSLNAARCILADGLFCGDASKRCEYSRRPAKVA